MTIICMGKSFLCIGDVHAPFTNTASLRRIEAIAREIKPQFIIQVGDALDLYSWSKYSKTLNLMTPQNELELGKKMLYTMWENLKKASPKSKCFQLIGNHDERIVKKLMEKAPELQFLYKVEAIFDLPRGIELSNCEREELIIDDILFMHGHRKFGDHVKHNRMNTVCGHLHKGGVVFERMGKKTIWELNCGFIAQTDSVPMTYSKQTKISHYTQGVGLIDSMGPRFIPFENI